MSTFAGSRPARALDKRWAQLASSRKRAEALAGELTGTASPLPELEEEQDEEEPDAVLEEPPPDSENQPLRN